MFEQFTKKDIRKGEIVQEFLCRLMDEYAKCVESTQDVDRDKFNCNEITFLTAASFSGALLAFLSREIEEDPKKVLKLFSIKVGEFMKIAKESNLDA